MPLLHRPATQGSAGNVYSGLEFERDSEPDPAKWTKQALDLTELVDALGRGQVVAWVQGRWEIGPRALGNRSLLAEPFDPRTRDRLNEIKLREDYRPVAPCCRLEDAGHVFDTGFEDPYMLYFRRVRPEHGLGAVTHVDGSARAQTVTKETNRRLYDLLSAFAAVHGCWRPLQHVPQLQRPGLHQSHVGPRAILRTTRSSRYGCRRRLFYPCRFLSAVSARASCRSGRYDRIV